MMAGYMIYCPLNKVIRKWSDRTKVVEEPLFKGYVFIQIEDHKRNDVLNYPGIVRYLFWQRRPAIVLEDEIATMQKWLVHYIHERLKGTNIKPGSNIPISSGMFMNVEGVLLDASNFKAYVQLRDLGIQLSLDLTQNEIQSLKS